MSPRAPKRERPDPELITRAGAALLAIAENPDRTIRQMERDLGWPKDDLRRQLRRLEEAGALGRRSVGNSTRCELHREAQVGSLLPGRTVGEFLDALQP